MVMAIICYYSNYYRKNIYEMIVNNYKCTRKLKLFLVLLRILKVVHFVIYPNRIIEVMIFN